MKMISAAILLALVLPAMASDQCGFPPGTRIGCRGTPICACDETGCRWLWLECER
jgi:hypothetical protein